MLSWDPKSHLPTVQRDRTVSINSNWECLILMIDWQLLIALLQAPYSGENIYGEFTVNLKAEILPLPPSLFLFSFMLFILQDEGPYLCPRKQMRAFWLILMMYIVVCWRCTGNFQHSIFSLSYWGIFSLLVSLFVF